MNARPRAVSAPYSSLSVAPSAPSEPLQRAKSRSGRGGSPFPRLGDGRAGQLLETGVTGCTHPDTYTSEGAPLRCFRPIQLALRRPERGLRAPSKRQVAQWTWGRLAHRFAAGWHTVTDPYHRIRLPSGLHVAVQLRHSRPCGAQRPIQRLLALARRAAAARGSASEHAITSASAVCASTRTQQLSTDGDDSQSMGARTPRRPVATIGRAELNDRVSAC